MLIAHFLLHVVLMLFQLVQDALQFVRLGTRSRPTLQAENLFLRKQLALYLERKAKPRRANDPTRLTLVILSNFFAWKDAMRIVKPETFMRWHRKGFRLFWRWKSRPRGQPLIPFIMRNPLRARRTLEIKKGADWGVNPAPG
jgi:putative transposase